MSSNSTLLIIIPLLRHFRGLLSFLIIKAKIQFLSMTLKDLHICSFCTLPNILLFTLCMVFSFHISIHECLCSPALLASRFYSFLKILLKYILVQSVYIFAFVSYSSTALSICQLITHWLVIFSY